MDEDCEVSMPFALQHNVHVDFSSSNGFTVRAFLNSNIIIIPKVMKIKWNPKYLLFL